MISMLKTQWRPKIIALGGASMSCEMSFWILFGTTPLESQSHGRCSELPMACLAHGGDRCVLLYLVRHMAHYVFALCDLCVGHMLFESMAWPAYLFFSHCDLMLACSVCGAHTISTMGRCRCYVCVSIFPVVGMAMCTGSCELWIAIGMEGTTDGTMVIVLACTLLCGSRFASVGISRTALCR